MDRMDVCSVCCATASLTGAFLVNLDHVTLTTRHNPSSPTVEDLLR